MVFQSDSMRAGTSGYMFVTVLVSEWGCHCEVCWHCRFLPGAASVRCSYNIPDWVALLTCALLVALASPAHPLCTCCPAPQQPTGERDCAHMLSILAAGAGK